MIDLIILPGEDQLDDVDLLSYPLLAHELGHYLLLRDDSSLRNAFSPCLAKRVRSLKLASMADKGAARTKAQAIINELESLWTPSADHSNWAHELAIDLVALWTCGPAYLACFEDTVEHQQPYHITQDHPPYAVRLEALVHCARKLGFDEYCNGLEKLRANWAKSQTDGGKNNRFLALADRQIIDACSRAALELCEALRLSKCTPSTLATITRSTLATITRSDGIFGELGVPLLLYAWHMFQHKDERAFQGWQRATVSWLARGKVMPLSR